MPKHDARARGALPVAPLLALATTGFVAIMTETLPAGLLGAIGAGLGVSDSLAGQLVTAYAAGSLLAALPLTVATLGWRRRPVLLLSVLGLLAFNSVTAVSPFYQLTLIARFLAGVSAGLAWGIIAGYARRLVDGPRQGRALALAMIGTPVALALGVPLGTFVGAVLGWRLTFAAMSGLTLALALWVKCSMPDVAGQSPDGRPSVGAVFSLPGLRPVLFVIVAWMVAHNILYTYIGPLVAAAGLRQRLDLVLLVFGIAALCGIWLAGVLVDRRLRQAVLGSLSAFALAALGIAVAAHDPMVVCTAVALWGVTFGGAATLLGTAGADAAGAAVDIAQAMNTTAWNAAIATGGLTGGVLLDRFGSGALPWAALLAALAALMVAWQSREAGFPPGARSRGSAGSAQLATGRTARSGA